MCKIQLLYLAFGYSYLVMAINSARTAKSAGTSCHIKLVTNLPLKRVTLDDETPFDEIIVLESTKAENRLVKIRMIDFADGPIGVFLDCDTEIKFPLHRFSPIISNFDVALRNTKGPTKWEFALADGSTSIDTAISELNTGVIFFSKSEGTKELFNLWRQYFQEMGLNRDQPSFLRALVHSKIARLFPLGAGRNAIPVPRLDLAFMQQSPEAVRILHYKDPSYWPSVALNLGHVHRCADLEFFGGVKPEREMELFGALARQYEHPLFQHQLGRRLINWRLRRASGREAGTLSL